jgi:serine/threonine-protein kinase
MARNPGSRPSLAGRTFSDFEVLDELGSGGMGVVYRARDRRLDRTVALKVLAPLTGSNAEAQARFLREARAASSLDHPNVGVVHGILDGPEGEPCIVMAYYEGETLSRRIARGPVPLAEAANITLQVAEGLAAAHDKGIVHRDIKPSNILIGSTGIVKILDFGLAKFTEADHTLTNPETILGTAQYMAPEQVQGAAVDARTDVWAVGAILYEMLRGEPPFCELDTYALLYAVVEKPIPRLEAVPPDVERVVTKALAKRPEDRYGSMRELAADLRRAAAVSDGFPAPPPQLLSSGPAKGGIVRSRQLSLAIVILTIITAVALAWWYFRFPGAKQGRTVVAVLPFSATGDAATAALADGLAEALAGRIARLEVFRDRLELVSTSDAIARNVSTARDAQVKLGATFTVSGSLAQEAAGGLRLDLDVEQKGESQPVRATLRDPQGDIRGLESRTLAELAAMLGITIDAASTVGVRSSATAYANYVRGLGYLQRWDRTGNLDKALAAFGDAVREDPGFARAYVGLAEASRTKYRVDKDAANLQHALNYAREAARIEPNLADAHVALGRLHQEAVQRDLAIVEFQRALDLAPRNPAALLGMARAHEDLGRAAEAETAYKRAVAMNPYSWTAHNTLAGFYLRQRRYADAETQYRRTLELTPDNAAVYNNLAAVLIRRQKGAEAKRMLERSLTLDPTYQAHVNLGNLYYGDGQFALAASVYDKALRMNSRDFRVWGMKAHALRLGGSTSEANEAYRRAIDLGEEALRVNSAQPRAASLMAVYYACLGDRARALANVQTALAMEASDPDVLQDAATAYELLGDRQAAVRWAQRAVDAGQSWNNLQNDRDLRNLVRSGEVRAPK